MKIFRDTLDFLFLLFPKFREFCFLALPLAFCDGTDGLYNAKIWKEYLAKYPKCFHQLPKCLDQESLKWVKRLLKRRRCIRSFLSVGEIYRYYKAKSLTIPYWFPDNGTMIKSVFLLHAGMSYLPRSKIVGTQDRILIDGGAASGDSSIALLQYGFKRALCFEPSLPQRREMEMVFKKNNLSHLVDVVPFALGESGGGGGNLYRSIRRYVYGKDNLYR